MYAYTSDINSDVSCGCKANKHNIAFRNEMVNTSSTANAAQSGQQPTVVREKKHRALKTAENTSCVKKILQIIVNICLIL